MSQQATVPTQITMYSTPWCGYCHRLRGQLDREGVSYTVIDIEEHPDAAAYVREVNDGFETVPTVVFADGSALTNPSLAQVLARVAQ
jgi:mycoredoxin